MAAGVGVLLGCCESLEEEMEVWGDSEADVEGDGANQAVEVPWYPLIWRNRCGSGKE
jgi:hypothetical protein